MRSNIAVLFLVGLLCAVGCETDNTPILPENATEEPPSFNVESDGDGQQPTNQLKPR